MFQNMEAFIRCRMLEMLGKCVELRLGHRKWVFAFGVACAQAGKAGFIRCGHEVKPVAGFGGFEYPTHPGSDVHCVGLIVQDNGYTLSLIHI